MTDPFDSDSNFEPRPSGPQPQPTAGYARSQAAAAHRLPPWAKFVALGLIVAFAIGSQLMFRFGQKATELETKPIEADPSEIAARETTAPFSLKSDDGKAVGFEAYKGNVVILSFWASWCAPCLVEMPTFVEVERKFSSRGLKVVAVNVDEDAEGRNSAHDFWKSKAFAFPNFFDLDRKLQEQFRIEMLPSNLVFDRQGRIAFKGFGANDWSNPQTQELLDQLLAEPAADAKPASPGKAGV